MNESDTDDSYENNDNIPLPELFYISLVRLIIIENINFNIKKSL